MILVINFVLRAMRAMSAMSAFVLSIFALCVVWLKNETMDLCWYVVCFLLVLCVDSVLSFEVSCRFVRILVHGFVRS